MDFEFRPDSGYELITMNNQLKTLALLLASVCVLAGCNSKRPTGVTRMKGEPPEFVFMSGEFQNPGKYPWTNGMSLYDGMTAAGGPTAYAKRRFTITHWDDTKVTYWLTYQKTLTNNPALEPGDSVKLPRPE